MTTVAVVEDDAALLRSTCRYLTKVGFAVSGFSDAETFLKAYRTNPFDIAVLDVNLPGQSGFEAGAELREISPTVGIIMLTARVSGDDRVTGVFCGADNYLTKPILLAELQGTILNLARRIGSSSAQEPQPEPEGEPSWTLDDREWRLIAPNGQSVGLTSAEFLILRTLIAASGRPVRREVILGALGKPPTAGEDRRIDNLLSLLRRKVQDGIGWALPVKAVRDQGYVFRDIAAPVALSSPN